MSSLVRSVIALHSLLLNKIAFKDVDSLDANGGADGKKVGKGGKEEVKEEPEAAGGAKAKSGSGSPNKDGSPSKKS